MAEEPPRGSNYAIKLMYVCMYVFKATFLPAIHRPRIFEEVPSYHCSKKDEPSIQKHLTLHQPVRKFSKSN